MNRALVVPHAPALLERAAGPTTSGRAAATVAAVSALDVESALVVLVSPHGPRSFVCSSGRGSLAGFGVPGLEVQVHVPDTAPALAREWGRPQADEPLDHGAAVPLVLLSAESAICCVTQEVTGKGYPVGSTRDEAAALASAIASLAESEDLTLVCSAHTSACLTPAAPLAYREEGKRLDAKLLDALATDPALLLDVTDDEWRGGRACGQLPFQVIGHLFRARPFDLKSYEYPFGVGYLVAETA